MRLVELVRPGMIMRRTGVASCKVGTEGSGSNYCILSDSRVSCGLCTMSEALAGLRWETKLPHECFSFWINECLDRDEKRTACVRG